MSRTIRRKNYVPYWITSESIRFGSTYRRVPLEGKELEKSLAKHHGDHGWACTASGINPGVWFRKKEQHKYRMKARQELIRFKKDNEYEVQIQARPHLPYWD